MWLPRFPSSRNIYPASRRPAAPLIAAALIVPLFTVDLVGALAQARDISGRSGVAEARRVAGESDFLLVAAQAELSRNQFTVARDMLETLISRFPNEPAAEEARRLLASLPRSAPESIASPSRDAGSPRSAGTIDTAFEARPNMERPSAPTIRRIRALDEDFRGSVGDRVFFGEASIEIGSKARAVLAAQASWLKRHPSLFITIDGHADDRGPGDLNRELAAQRAEAVKARLIEEGVEPDRIRVRALGRDSRIAVCPDPGCSAQNRRVVTVLSDRFGGPQQAGTQGGTQGPTTSRSRGN